MSSISDDVEATKKSSNIVQPISGTTINLDTKVPNVISPEKDYLSSLSEPSSSTHEVQMVSTSAHDISLGTLLSLYNLLGR